MFKENPQNFINNSSIGIHAVSPDGIIEYANKYELDMLGYAWAEYVGHAISEFQIDTDILHNMVSRLNKFEILKNYPSKVKTKDGITYVLYNSSVYSEDGRFVHTRCYGTEIDEMAFNLFHQLTTEMAAAT